MAETPVSVPLVRAQGIGRSYGAVRALRGVDLEVAPGEVHGLVGANGAGKSTLIRIVAGLEEPDSGRLEVNGEPVRFHTTDDATRHGFAFIHQELNLIPKFTVTQNLALGVKGTARLGFVDSRGTRAKAELVAERLRLSFPLNALVERLSVPNQWLVSIGRALMQDARLIVMDEPSASLSATEAERLFEIVRELSASGVAVLYVSHRLDEIVDLCDRVTVFKDGLTVASLGRGAFQRDDLVRQIVGREIEPDAGTATPVEHTAPVLEVDHVSRLPMVRDVTLTIHRGEVLGIAGLVGSGRTELAEVLFGAARPDAGTMRLSGEPYRPGSPSDAIARGIALVPEERRSQGVLLNKSISFNLNLPTLRLLRLGRWLPLLNTARGRRRAEETARRLTVKFGSIDQPVGSLSGGNQQKVVMGKWLVAGGVKVLVLDEPSKGVDVGARAEIFRLVRGLAEDGMSVLMICSEFGELATCDRVLVMVEGRIVGEARGAAVNEENLLNMCYAKGAPTP